MSSRFLVVLAVALASAAAACSADPLSPLPSGTVLRDEEACDTIWVDSSEVDDEEPPEDDEEGCHIVLIHY